EGLARVGAPGGPVGAGAAGGRRGAGIRPERAAAARMGVVRGDAEFYPPLLRTIVDPPPVLWVRGGVEILTRPAVAIVGSRAASPYALEVASRLAAELADRNVLVVSGLARGVDGAAHRSWPAGGGGNRAG